MLKEKRDILVAEGYDPFRVEDSQISDFVRLMEAPQMEYNKLLSEDPTNPRVNELHNGIERMKKVYDALTSIRYA